MFENLIGNAIKFTKAGGCITVGAASRDHEVVFRVADTGSGIASENLPRVFDRFWQATRAGRQAPGSAFPSPKGIVEAHGGRIWVERRRLSGTTVLVYDSPGHPRAGSTVRAQRVAPFSKVTEPLRSASHVGSQQAHRRQPASRLRLAHAGSSTASPHTRRPPSSLLSRSQRTLCGESLNR